MENGIVYSQLQEVKLQNNAIQFISQIKLILNGVVIIPKEIEVYYYKEGEFSDESVHRNELQQNNMNHFYVHRNGKTKIDRYKGGTRTGIDFVVSNEKGVYYSYLIRSAVVNDKTFYGPHNVLEAIRISSNLDYKGIEDNAVVVEINDDSYDVILSQRINLGKGFVESKLRAVVFDNDFKNSKYRDKEALIIEKIRKEKLSKEKALFFAKKKFRLYSSRNKKYMITDNLTNTVYFSSLLHEKCPVLNAHIVDALRKRDIPFTYLKGTKDIWCRDYMPIQIKKDRFVFYRYTPDYLQDKIGLTLQTNLELVFREESNELLRLLPMSMEEEVRFDGLHPISISHPVFHRFELDLVMDGGNVVKCGDKVVMTDKVFVENKDKTPQEVQRQIEEAFQCEVVFLPWDRNEKYGHCDGIIHCPGDNRVLMTNYADFDKGIADEYLRILEKYFDVTILKYNVKRKHERSWSYINFLQIGTLVLVPQLGIPEDEQALGQISIALPNCEIVGIPALEAVRRGGALNCISWNIKV